MEIATYQAEPQPAAPIAGASPSTAPSRSLEAFLIALAVHLSARGAAAAENHVDYKYELYAEEADRTRVETHSALFEQRLAPGVALKGALVYDAISGATPTGGPPLPGSSQVPTVELNDIRRAGYLEPNFKFGRHTFAPQVAYSLENDYESVGQIGRAHI